MHVLVVCTGNTCRSPMAEALLKRELEVLGRTDVTVSSAGVAAYEGAKASAYAVEVLREEGIDLSQHRSRPATREMLESATVLCMTQGHLLRVKTLCPTADARLFCIDRDVPDPFTGSLDTYRRTAAVLKEAAKRLAREL